MSGRHACASRGTAHATSGPAKTDNVGLAAALMAGVSFSFDQRWVLDVGYRALYLEVYRRRHDALIPSP